MRAKILDIHDIQVTSCRELICDTVRGVWFQLGGSLTENFYTRAMAVSLQESSCTCHVEDPIPVPFFDNKDDRKHYIGTCRADINMLMPNRTRVLIEIKHIQANDSILKQAKQQVIKYNYLLGVNEREQAQILVVIIFPKYNDDSPFVVLYSKHGNELEKIQL